MEIAYYETKNWVRRTGNVVNLAEYRRALEEREGVDEGEDGKRPTSEEVDRVPILRHHRRASAPMLADYCASGAIVVMAVTVAVKMLTMF